MANINRISSSGGIPGDSNRNAIINGDFNVWQRGTSFAAIAHDAYTVDRFSYIKVATGAEHTISRDTDVPTQSESGHLSNYSMKVDCTTGDTSVNAGDLVAIRHYVEGYNFVPFVGKTTTLSFWVKAVKTGIYCITFGGSISDQNYVVEYTINSTNTWEKKTVTITFDYSTGTWDYTNGIGVYIDWVIMCGSTFQTTADTWHATDVHATSNQANGVDSTDNNFWLAQVKFEPGSNATDFECDDIGTTLTKCQRYYIDFTGRTINGDLWLSWPVEMRAVPILTDTVGTAANPTINGCTLNHSAAADVTITATSEL